MKNIRIYLGIFFISLATLSFELSLIRFFSISQWYHFAFMVVSISMFGMAVAGTFLAIKKLKKPLTWSSIGFSLSAFFGFFIINNISFDPFKAGINYWYSLNLLFYYLILGLPFFFFGIIIAFLFGKYRKISGKIYFWNMFGSSIGILIGLLIMSSFISYYILFIASLGILSLVLFSGSLFRIKVFSLIMVCIFLFSGLFFPGLFEIKISQYKELSIALDVPRTEIIDTKYNSISRIDIVNSSFVRYAPGLSPVYRQSLPPQLGVMIDGELLGAMTYYNIYDNTSLSFLDHIPTKLAFNLNTENNVLVINPGAGMDVLLGLNQRRNVTAVESNPLLINIIMNDYGSYSGHIYDKANVLFGDGRNFLKTNNDKFGIIILSLSGNLFGESSGISSLTENYFLTADAFSDYYESLTDDGVIIITRWLNFPPKESLRLFSLALKVDKNADNIAMFRSWTTVTLVITKQKITNETSNIIKNFAESNGLDIVYLPYYYEPNINLKFEEPFYHNALKSLLGSPDEFYDYYVFDVSPVFDNKPFYFNFFKLSKFNELRNMSDHWNPFLDSGFLVFFMFVKVLILSFILILLPLLIFHNESNQKRFLGYFFLIGIGYMFVQIVLIQKFILYLGQVMYSSAIIIFSMLLFSSLGALFSDKLNQYVIRKVLIIIAGLIFFSIFLIAGVMQIFSSFSLFFRIIIAIILIAPLGFMLGMPFPLGIKLIKKEAVSWAWAINGMASVIGPILAVIFALFMGYNMVLIFAGMVYLLGIIFLPPLLFQS
ncbi:MAG: hypothetical protein ACMXYG_04775 [Candidatus Woesearchaeota archaeon]